ncbi:MAG: RNA polymerase sigma factor for flagellar operon FliA [Halioglobus sp.]|jgi:RNA polymerase sigma factor for flagellar operon FliA
MAETVYLQSQMGSADDLVRDYLPLVKKIGLHLAARLPPRIELDDLLQVGMIGLIQAGSTYDASRGASFSTYAGIRVKGAMLDEVRRNDWVPRSVQQNMKRISQAISQLEARNGRMANDTEIAAELAISLEEYRDLSRELVYCRLSSLEDSNVTVESEEPDPFAQLENGGIKESLVEAIKSLPEKESLMMSLYYGEELNLKEIGVVMGVSESRVSQIHGQALARVRVKVSEWTE